MSDPFNRYDPSPAPAAEAQPPDAQVHPAPYSHTVPRRRNLAVRILRGLAMLLVGYYIAAVLMLVVYRFVDPPITGVQLERRLGALIAGRDLRFRQSDVAYERLPRHVPRAIMAAEDGNFMNHWGFDFAEMKKASAGIFDGQMPRGASTITQQLVKNLFGCTCRNPVRKLYDWVLTPPAELILGKERILELYLNNVEWGRGVFGIEAGARHHYGTSARGLSRSQAAGLAALLPNPLQRTPGTTPQYRSEILRRMSARGW
ncbi:MAG: monofunctional biosynthetic peptidoglycan transglycosylase [Gemmatimonadaceae bacterium]|nr:monofunctional biosynthetic peptidoglycan transglycosylase [Gemmatimonadaceae bacterium]